MGRICAGYQGVRRASLGSQSRILGGKDFVDSLRARESLWRASRHRGLLGLRPAKGSNRSKATELAFVDSKPLSEIARITNKESNNLYAELILRTLGQRAARNVNRSGTSGPGTWR